MRGWQLYFHKSHSYRAPDLAAGSTVRCCLSQRCGVHSGEVACCHTSTHDVAVMSEWVGQSSRKWCIIWCNINICFVYCGVVCSDVWIVCVRLNPLSDRVFWQSQDRSFQYSFLFLNYPRLEKYRKKCLYWRIQEKKYNLSFSSTENYRHMSFLLPFSPRCCMRHHPPGTGLYYVMYLRCRGRDMLKVFWKEFSVISGGSCSERGSVGVQAGRSAGLAGKQRRLCVWGCVCVCLCLIIHQDMTCTIRKTYSLRQKYKQSLDSLVQS